MGSPYIEIAIKWPVDFVGTLQIGLFEKPTTPLIAGKPQPPKPDRAGGQTMEADDMLPWERLINRHS